MRRVISKPIRRRGLSLLELIVASTLMTTVVTAVALLVRGMHVAWLAHDGDARQLEAAHAVARHIVRRIRQAASVTSISGSGQTAGSLTLTMTDGSLNLWSRSAGPNEVLYGPSAADQLLAQEITELSFTGYKADGVTTTTVAGEVQAIRCRVAVQLSRDTSPTRVVVCWAWLRAW